MTFEITENTPIDNFDVPISLLKSLQLLCCYTIMTDLGVGLSFIAFLKDFPVYSVYIHGSFVSNHETDALDMAMVTTMHAGANAVVTENDVELVDYRLRQQIANEYTNPAKYHLVMYLLELRGLH